MKLCGLSMEFYLCCVKVDWLSLSPVTGISLDRSLSLCYVMCHVALDSFFHVIVRKLFLMQQTGFFINCVRIRSRNSVLMRKIQKPIWVSSIPGAEPLEKRERETGLQLVIFGLLAARVSRPNSFSETKWLRRSLNPKHRSIRLRLKYNQIWRKKWLIS